MKTLLKTLSAAGILMVALGGFVGVASSRAVEADDSLITAKVKSALLQEPSAKARQIKVKTLHGVVQLSGYVDSPESKQRAEVIASTTEGVTDVRNDLKVRATSSNGNVQPMLPDDSAVVVMVKEALSDNATTRARDIHVSTVQQGDVQLSGMVASSEEKNEASRVAAGVNGVLHVQNDLEIGSLIGPTIE